MSIILINNKTDCFASLCHFVVIYKQPGYSPMTNHQQNVSFVIILLWIVNNLLPTGDLLIVYVSLIISSCISLKHYKQTDNLSLDNCPDRTTKLLRLIRRDVYNQNC